MTTFKLYLTFIVYMSLLQIRVGRFQLEQKLYEGKYSTIYSGCNLQSDADCSIKCESKNIKPSFVINEGKVLQSLQGGTGIPNFLWQGQNEDFNFLVTQLLGNSIEDYLQLCQGVFSLKTVLMIADKVLLSLQFIHDKNFVHRDIQPGNFLMGVGKKINQLFIIDYAFATPYYDELLNKHRPDYQSFDQNHFIGTLKFSSVAVLRGHRHSRRSDLQSFGLMMIYFLKGHLPWASEQRIVTPIQKRKYILAQMESISLQQICNGLPKEFLVFMGYCRCLQYNQRPDYSYLRRIFNQKFIHEGYQNDNIYDWLLLPLRLKHTKLLNRIPLSSPSKKESNDPAMANSDYNFKEDFDYMDQCIKIKKTPQKEKEKLISEYIKDSPPWKEKITLQQKSDPRKNGKDCQIY